MNPKPLVCIALLLGGPWAGPAWGKVNLASVFGSNMVLQREQPVPVRGTAEPGEAVTLRFAGQEKKGVADASGKWTLVLDPLPVMREPQTMTITGAPDKGGKPDTLELKNILVGDVWLCSGQSNMAWQLSKVRDAEQEIAAADFPEIRIFGIHFTAAPEPREDVQGTWAECRPERAAKASAVAYFFARDLYQQVQIPIGLMGSALSGSHAEVWVSREAQLADRKTRAYLEAWDWLDQNIKVAERGKPGPNGKPTVYVDHTGATIDLKAWDIRFAQWKKACAQARKTGAPLPTDFPPGFEPLNKLPRPDNAIMRPAVGFNNSIAPLTRLPIKGAIWYQGESHIIAQEYGSILTCLIKDWRQRFSVGDFPFLIVGLPNWASRPAVAGAWPWVREQQLNVAGELPNVFVTVNTDTAIPDHGDLHPKNKQPVGRRLALLAAARVYGKEVAAEGPRLDRMSVEGKRVRLSFRNAADGLEAQALDIPGLPAEVAASPLRGFAVAGEDREWVGAEAAIEGHTVVLSAPGVEKPVAVRYNWADYPIGNLFGKSGLPAVPFRTDQWPR